MFRRKKHVTASMGRIAWKKLLHDPLAVSGLVVITLAFTVALLGYLITPDQSPNCNKQFLELSARPPGFSVTILKVRKNEPEKKVGKWHTMLYGKISPYDHIPVNRLRFESNRIMAEEFSDVPGETLYLREFSLPDVVYAIDPLKPVRTEGDRVSFTLLDGTHATASLSSLQEQILENQVVQQKFLLGTDRFGRDLLSRLMLGTRISLSVGFISVFISLVIGIGLGAAGGYFLGWVDSFVLWLINVVWSVPTLLMVIAITLVLGKGFWQIFVAVGLTMWVEVARVVRGQVLGLRQKEYVEAARAMGFPHFRILFRHILPNAFSPVIIISAANFASAILIEAGLSFLGIGVQPPLPSWGTMIKDHYGYIIMDQAYLAILPGLAIMLMVLSFTLLGNGLRDALDTRTLSGSDLKVPLLQDQS